MKSLLTTGNHVASCAGSSIVELEPGLFVGSLTVEGASELEPGLFACSSSVASSGMVLGVLR